MPTPSKKKKNADIRYHFTNDQKRKLLAFDKKHCERTRSNVSARKMVKLIEQEFKLKVTHQTFTAWRNNRDKIMQSASLDSSAVKIRDPQLQQFEDGLDTKFDETSRSASLTLDLAREIATNFSLFQ